MATLVKFTVDAFCRFCGGGFLYDDIVLANFCGPFKETAMQIEDVAGVGFASGGASEKQGDLAVGDGMFGEVVVDDDGMLSFIAEVLSDGATGVGSDVLHRSRVGGVGGHNDGVVHGTSSL